MYGAEAVATRATAEVVTLGEPIIPEVTIEGKELVYVLEVDLVQPAVD